MGHAVGWVEDLAPVDEFHIGGRVATKEFLDQLEITADDRVLDIGCGLGGASRFTAQEYGCRVTGIDLTDEYVRTGEVLCAWVGLGHRVTLEQGDATATPYADGEFAKAYMLHVGMNIADKDALATELYRILRPALRAQSGRQSATQHPVRRAVSGNSRRCEEISQRSRNRPFDLRILGARRQRQLSGLSGPPQEPPQLVRPAQIDR